MTNEDINIELSRYMNKSLELAREFDNAVGQAVKRYAEGIEGLDDKFTGYAAANCLDDLTRDAGVFADYCHCLRSLAKKSDVEGGATEICFLLRDSLWRK